MKYTTDYIFYRTDESFDYGDWSWGGTCYEYADHGFSIEMDTDDNIYIDTLEAYGDFTEMNDKCKTLEQLKQYILDHFNEIDNSLDICDKYENGALFEEFISFIDENLEKKVA